MPLSPEQLTIIGLLLAIGGAGLKQLWVFGWTFSAMEEDRDFWRDTALRLLKVNEKALPSPEQTDG